MRMEIEIPINPTERYFLLNNEASFNPIKNKYINRICGKNMIMKWIPRVLKIKLGRKPPACDESPNRNGR
jgi:hypothetical protein